ncbi:MAG: glucokinase [Nanobdellota archaeon]
MSYVLCGDIGGTNANLSIMDIRRNKPKIVKLKHNYTKNITNFVDIINDFLLENNDKFNVKEACFSIAGPIESGRVHQKTTMTNADIKIDTQEIMNKTSLEKVVLINDFEAISYATNIIEEKDIHNLHNGIKKREAARAVMGAGTGLGASILYYNKTKKLYTPLPSEGGHCDFVATDSFEWEICDFIKRNNNTQFHPENEDIVSGRGIELIYKYLTGREKSAEQITQSKQTDETAKKTYEIFVRLFARCCKNFALETLCKGGLFIAGGIAGKNYEAFDGFMKEFTTHKRKNYSEMLQKIPVKIITNYNVSHIGAAYALYQNFMKK